MSYYLDYINILINANEEKVRKPAEMLDLSKVFDALKIKSYDNLTIDKIEVCGNSKGCTPKSRNGHDDFLVKMKSNKVNIATKLANNKTKYVLLNIDGKYNFDGVEQNIHIRIPKSGTIGLRIGMKNQTNILVNSKNSDTKLNSLLKTLTKLMKNIIKGLEIVKPTKIVAISIKGLNIFNPKTANRPEHKIFNFLYILRQMDKYLPNHELDFNQRNGKQIIRGNFKPLEQGKYATIGITPWGMTDFMGSSSISDTQKLIKDVISAFNKVKSEIKYDKNSKPPKQFNKDKKCRVGQILSLNGNCPDGMLPYPKADGTLCCKKVQLTNRIKNDLVNKYRKFNIPLPNSLKNYARNSSVKIANVPTYNVKKGKWIYKDKVYNCMSLRKPEIKLIAQKLQLNPQGFQKDICKHITEHLETKRLEGKKKRIQNLRRMKAKLMNKIY